MPNTVGQKMSEYTPLDNLTESQQRTYLGNAAVTTFGIKEAGGATINVNVPLDAIKPTVPVTDVQVGGISVLNNGVAEVPAIPDASSLADGTSITASNGKLSAVIPVTDVQVGGTSVLNNGVAEVPAIPAISGSSTIDYVTGSGGKLVVKVPVPPPGQNHADVGKVLTVVTVDDTDEVAWSDVSDELPDIGTDQNRGKYLKVDDNSDSLVWDSPTVPEISQYNGDVSAIKATNDVSSGGYVFDVNLDSNTLEKRSTQGASQVSYIAVKNPVPSTTSATDGDVLTYDATDGIVWSAPQGGGGGGLPDASKIIGQPTGSGGDYALFMPYCNITRDGDGKVATVGEIKWIWADVLTFPDGYHEIPQ